MPRPSQGCVCASRENFRNAGRVLVAERQGEVTGFATILTRAPRSDPDDAWPEHTQLAELAVLPEHRGAGIGTALIVAAEALAREGGAPVLRVAVVADNAGARRLYARHGFGEAQVLMQKTLKKKEDGE